MTSSGEPIRERKAGANKNPTSPTKIPKNRATVIAVCTISVVLLLSLRPIASARQILTPTETPTNKQTIKLISDPVEPTAATANSPSNCPTTTMSTALKSSCRIPVSARGIAKRRIFPRRGPLVISISPERRAIASPPFP